MKKRDIGLMMLFLGLTQLLLVHVSDFRAAFIPVEDSNSWDKCNSFMVGKKATTDGSVICTQTAGTTRAWYHPAADHEPGAKRVVKCYNEYDKLGMDRVSPVRSGPTLEIPEVGHTYAYIEGDWWPFMNEHQVSIGETTLGRCRKELAPSKNSDAKLRLTDVVRIAIERAATAREAIRIMGSLMEEFGFNPYRPAVGEFVSVADKNEVWAWELVPVGPSWKKGSGEPGVAWSAMRIPDDMFAPSCNESIIGEIDLDDKDRFMASSNAISLARKNGWWDSKSGQPFRWDLAYWGKRANSLRTWRALSIVSPSQNLKPGAEGYPIPIKPDHRLSVLDIRKIYADHYQGTDFDKTRGLPAGPFGCPWWPKGTPNNRSSIPGSSSESIAIAQSRDWLPDPIGGIIWIGLGGSGDLCVLVPFYAGITNVPKPFTIGIKTKFDWDSAYWLFNLVGSWAQLNYKNMAEEITKLQEAIERMELSMIDGIDEEAYSLYRDNPNSAIEFLNNFCDKNASKVLDAWRELAAFLIARYAPSSPFALEAPESWRELLSKVPDDF